VEGLSIISYHPPYQNEQTCQMLCPLDATPKGKLLGARFYRRAPRFIAGAGPIIPVRANELAAIAHEWAVRADRIGRLGVWGSSFWYSFSLLVRMRCNEFDAYLPGMAIVEEVADREILINLRPKMRKNENDDPA
jgi:hypothetical protein